MSLWVALAVIVLAYTMVMVLVGMGTRKVRKQYHREIAEWALARGWTPREGGRDPAWKTRLPRGVDGQVDLQIDGASPRHGFTLVHLQKHTVTYAATAVVIEIDFTVVVVYLPTVHPYTEIRRRSLFRRPSTSDTIGYAEFDKKFRVLTKASDGAAAVISTALAEAHLNGDVPLWTLRDNELICHSIGKPEAKTLDATLGRALRVAELITAPREPGA
jgi:hypothetical protein